MLTVVSLVILFSFLANKYSLFIKSIGIQNDNIYDYKIYAKNHVRNKRQLCLIIPPVEIT